MSSLHNELPEIASTGYVSNNLVDFGESMIVGGNVWNGDLRAIDTTRFSNPLLSTHYNQQPTTEVGTMNQKRIVQVFIADPDKRVPVDESLLYRGEQKLTDLTDQELFFEIDVKGSLDKHNEKRVKLVDKEASQRAGKDVLLEPVKIRDLKMTVVVVATF